MNIRMNDKDFWNEVELFIKEHPWKPTKKTAR
jgi:hypothetical protein